MLPWIATPLMGLAMTIGAPILFLFPFFLLSFFLIPICVRTGELLLDFSVGRRERFLKIIKDAS